MQMHGRRATLRKRFASDPNKLDDWGFIAVSGFSRNGSVTDDPFAASYHQPWHGLHFDDVRGELPIHVFYDFSSVLADGRGYALLYSNDGAGPDIPSAFLKTVIDSQRPPLPVDASKMREICGTGVR
jgi:hypothetical protein